MKSREGGERGDGSVKAKYILTSHVHLGVGRRCILTVTKTGHINNIQTLRIPSSHNTHEICPIVLTHYRVLLFRHAQEYQGLRRASEVPSRLCALPAVSLQQLTSLIQPWSLAVRSTSFLHSKDTQTA